jgi:enterochelin esterase-like enzyme
VFAPDSRGLLLVLAVLAVVFMVLAATRGGTVRRLVSGLLGLIAAALLGVVAVNVYFGYFTSWGDVRSGISGGPAATVITAPSAGAVVAPTTVAKQLAALPTSPLGYLLSVALPGPLSGITRTGFVWLPPQYREAAYAHTRFAVLELVPGTPGQPADWVTNFHAPTELAAALTEHRIGPMVVVLAPSNPPTGHGHGEECTNAPGGPQDATYVGRDIPDDVARMFRVAPPGRQWAIAGYSSGGYCAANLAVQQPGAFGAVADLDGYLAPTEDGPLWHVIFHRDTAAITANDVLAELKAQPTLALPPFYLAAGTGNREDLHDLDRLRAALKGRTSVSAHVKRGAGHTFPVWRAELPAMFTWIWKQLRPA